MYRSRHTNIHTPIHTCIHTPVHPGGGFHRYSTDPNWHVPHFEIMLYDVGQLLVRYVCIHPSIHPFVYLSIYLSVYVSIFHRYSADPNWHVPHFEIMLYDVGQLLVRYVCMYICMYPSSHLCTYRSIHPLWIYPSICLCTYPSINVKMYGWKRTLCACAAYLFCVFFHLYLSIYLSI